MWLGAFTSETKTHPGISPFQMFLEGWELPICGFSRLKKRIPDALFHAHTRIRAFLHFKCFSKGGNCPDAFFRAQKTHPGISPFQMLLEGWELPRCVFRGSKNAFQMRCSMLTHASGHFSISNASRRLGTAPMRFSGLKKRIRAFLHFKCFLKGGSCPDAFFQAQKTHPGISPFQMLLEGWELPRCVFSKFRECILSRVIRIIIKFVECIL